MKFVNVWCLYKSMCFCRGAPVSPALARSKRGASCDSHGRQRARRGSLHRTRPRRGNDGKRHQKYHENRWNMSVLNPYSWINSGKIACKWESAWWNLTRIDSLYLGILYCEWNGRGSCRMIRTWSIMSKAGSKAVNYHHFLGDRMESWYPLVNCPIAMERSTMLLMGKSTINCHFQ